MTTHENTPEVVESWEIPEEAKIVLNYPLSAEDAGELLKDIYALTASQKQKQIEEIVGILEEMSPWRECYCGSFLKEKEIGYHTCGAFIGNTPTETEGLSGYKKAIDDLITKILAKQ